MPCFESLFVDEGSRQHSCAYLLPIWPNHTTSRSHSRFALCPVWQRSSFWLPSSFDRFLLQFQPSSVWVHLTCHWDTRLLLLAACFQSGVPLTTLWFIPIFPPFSKANRLIFSCDSQAEWVLPCVTHKDFRYATCALLLDTQGVLRFAPLRRVR